MSLMSLLLKLFYIKFDCILCNFPLSALYMPVPRMSCSIGYNFCVCLFKLVLYVQSSTMVMLGRCESSFLIHHGGYHDLFVYPDDSLTS